MHQEIPNPVGSAIPSGVDAVSTVGAIVAVAIIVVTIVARHD